MRLKDELNIALIHDWFSGKFTGGAEKVFKEIEGIIIDNNLDYEIFCLVNHLKNLIKYEIKLMDDYNIDGDFIESQAFAYLATRSYLGLPISFPKTTGVVRPCTGGVIIEN